MRPARPRRLGMSRAGPDRRTAARGRRPAVAAAQRRWSTTAPTTTPTCAAFPSSLPELEADLCRQADLVITTSETLCADAAAVQPEHALGAQRRRHRAFLSHSRAARRAARIAEAGDRLRRRPVRVGRHSAGGGAGQEPSRVVVRAGRARRHRRLAGCRSAERAAARPAAVRRSARPSWPAWTSALIPFKQDQVTYHADPIKAYEYLAAGVPVVATDLPALRRLGHVVRLATSPACFPPRSTLPLPKTASARRRRQAEAARHSGQVALRPSTRSLNRPSHAPPSESMNVSRSRAPCGSLVVRCAGSGEPYGESRSRVRGSVRRVGGAAPPAPVHCSARASLRAHFRGDPPRRAEPPRDGLNGRTSAPRHRPRARAAAMAKGVSHVTFSPGSVLRSARLARPTSRGGSALVAGSVFGRYVRLFEPSRGGSARRGGSPRK